MLTFYFSPQSHEGSMSRKGTFENVLIVQEKEIISTSAKNVTFISGSIISESIIFAKIMLKCGDNILIKYNLDGTYMVSTIIAIINCLKGDYLILEGNKVIFIPS